MHFIEAQSSSPDTVRDAFKKAAAQLGAAGGKVLMNVLGKVAAEALKKSLGL